MLHYQSKHCEEALRLLLNRKQNIVPEKSGVIVCTSKQSFTERVFTSQQAASVFPFASEQSYL